MPKTARNFVQPRPGRTVRYPGTPDVPKHLQRTVLPTDGAFVVWSPYWATRVRTGDVIRATPSDEAAAKERRRQKNAEAAARFNFTSVKDVDAYGRASEVHRRAQAAVKNAGNVKNAAEAVGKGRHESTGSELEGKVAALEHMLAAYESAALDTAEAEAVVKVALKGAAGDVAKAEIKRLAKEIGKFDSTAKGRVTKTRNALEAAVAELEAERAKNAEAEDGDDAAPTEDNKPLTPPPAPVVDGDEAKTEEG